MALPGALRLRSFDVHCNGYEAQKQYHFTGQAQKMPLSPRKFLPLKKSFSNRIKAISQNSSVLCEEQTESGEKQSNTSQFMFHAEGGGQIRVFVRKLGSKHLLNVEVMLGDVDDPVFLHWGIFRSDASDWVVLQAETAPVNTSFLSGKDEAMRTQLERSPSGLHHLHLELSPEMFPSYVSFVLYQPASSDHKEQWIRHSSGSNFCVPVGLEPGNPEPLGVTIKADGSANFALFSRNATSVTLCLYNDADVEPAMEIDLEASVHRTGDVWHVKLPSIESFARYGYRCKGEESWENGNRFHKRRVLLDPYAKFIAPPVPGQEEMPSPAISLGVLRDIIPEFAWEDDSPPCIPLNELVVYRLNVAGFTSDCSSGLDEVLRGSFLGLSQKIEHLKSLGVNAVLLQPVFSCDKTQGQYYPQSFFSPMDAYDHGNTSLSAGNSLKEMVKSLHKNGIEVLLDVVYTQTAENGDDAPETISFRGIDNQTYYILNPRKKIMQSESGGPNMFNCNHPAVHRMITDSLRYWVEEYHVDGFCFVNAPGLLKGPHGEELSRPLLVEAISFDPVLSASKLIADPCSPSKPNFSKSIKFPHWKRWCEWNTSYHNDVNSFFRGDPGTLSDFATRLCGSADHFSSGRGPSFSFNYISNSYAPEASFSSKTGLAEDSTHISSPSESNGNLAIQHRKVRNLLATLFLSQGVPVLNMGDEFYCGEDSGTKSIHKTLDWSKLEKDEGLCHFISSLFSFRARRKDLLQRNSFIEANKISWQGLKPEDEPQWNDTSSSFLGVTLKASKDNASVGDLFLAFNSHAEALSVELPEAPTHSSWLRIMDTSFSHPHTVTLNGAKLSSQAGYEVQPLSVLVLEAYPNPD